VALKSFISLEHKALQAISGISRITNLGKIIKLGYEFINLWFFCP